MAEEEPHRTSVVFPPTNHEGLNLHQQPQTHNQTTKPSSPDSNGHKSAAMEGPVAVNRRLLRFNLPAIFSCIWKFSVIRDGLLRSLSFPLIGSTVLLLLFYFRLRLRRWRRRRLRDKAIDELLGVIKEKDERINRLLNQIARMNELLLASHHGVPIT